MLSHSEAASCLGVFVVLSFAANSVLGSLGCGRTRLDGHPAAPSQSADSGIVRDTLSGLDATLDVVLVRDAPREPLATADAESIFDVRGANDIAASRDAQSGFDAAFDGIVLDAPQELSATADAESNFDGTRANEDRGPNNMCSANAPVMPPDSPVHGTFTGSNVDVLVCDGGVTTYLRGTSSSFSTSPYLQWFQDNLAAYYFGGFSIRQPQNVDSVDFSALLGVSSTTPGTYTSAQACGGVVLCVNSSIPVGLDCSTDAGFDCPPGCALMGPSFDLTCMPVRPSTCYVAQGSSDCVADTQTPMGSWQLTLTSISLFSNQPWYVTHGSLTATMVSDQDATDTFSLSLDF